MQITKKHSEQQGKDLWGYDGRINGKRHRDFRFETKKMAEEAWNALFQSVVRDDYGINKRSTTTLKDAYELYAATYEAKAQSKSYAYRASTKSMNAMLLRFVEAIGPTTPVRTITLQHMLEWVTREGKSPETTSAYAKRLSGMLSMAKSNFPDLSAWRVPKQSDYALAPGSDRFRIIEPGEAQALVNVLLSSGNKVDREVADVFRIALLTGMRADEVLRLSFDNLLVKSQKIVVTGTKSGKNRTIPYPASVRALIEQRRADGVANDKHVFPHRFEIATFNSTITVGLKRGAALAGITYGRNSDNGFTLHDARATYLTNLDRAGLSVGTIRKLSGHSTLSALQRYLRPIENEEEVAVQVAESFFQSQPKVKRVAA